MRERFCRCLFFLVVSLLTACTHNTQFLRDNYSFPGYPSSSAITYINGRFFIMGDDATHLLVLDSLFAQNDTVLLFADSLNRMAKDRKADLESMSVVADKDTTRILLLGSGSLNPTRNEACLINPVNFHVVHFRLDTFYQRLRSQGLAELNIEGSCAIPGSFLLANRGHKGNPQNLLIFTDKHFWDNQYTSRFRTVRLGVSTDTNSFQGVSGMDYSQKGDKLLLSVSTEDTRSVMADGLIGKSYLWIIDNISTKKNWLAINPNRIIDLEKIDPAFKGQKIESVCLIRETEKYMEVALVADNDDGSSRVFRVDISKL